MEGRPTLSDKLLAVEMKHRVGGLSLDVSFALTRPWTVLFGPSGSGKTTVLRTIAGFVRPDAGRIVLGGEDGQVVFDHAAGIWIPAHSRNVRIAGQQAYLFPGSVRKNISYGVELKSDEAQDWMDGLLDRFRLKELEDVDVSRLSGGERQRVSVARAVAGTLSYSTRRPLLLDEPFAGMDAAMRDELATGLQNWLQENRIPVLSVTHDVGEAFLLGAEVARMAEGRVMEQGPVEVVLAEERRRLMERLRVG
jgi:molybdate transport system ATP-binding protein